MKKMMIACATLLLLGTVATAQTKRTTTRPASSGRVTDSDTLNPANRDNIHTPEQKDLLYNSNGTKIDMNKRDMNSTQPGTNQPGNKLDTPPRQIPAIPNTHPEIYTTPKDQPQVPPTPPTPVPPQQPLTPNNGR